MAQLRDFEYKQDDATRRMNARLVGILEPGRYRGFAPAAFGANMNLQLTHTVGGVSYPTGNTFAPSTGVVLSKQGVIVKETEALNFSVVPNTSALPRIDLVVMTHAIADVTGGQPATYSIIQGTPAADPAMPALTDPSFQVVLGSLLIPGNTSQLNAAGVVYTQAATPTLGNDVSRFVALQGLIDGISERITELTLDDLADVVIPATAAGHALIRTDSNWTSVDLITFIQQRMIRMAARFEQSHTVKTQANIEVGLTPLPGATQIAKQWHLNNGDFEHGNAIFINSTDEAYWPDPAPVGFYEVHSITSGAQIGTRLDFCYVAGTSVVEFIIQAGQNFLGTGIVPGTFILPPIFKKGMTAGQKFTPEVGVTYGLLRRPTGWEILEYA